VENLTPRQELLEGSEAEAREKCDRKEEAEQHRQEESTSLEKKIVSTRGEW